VGSAPPLPPPCRRCRLCRAPALPLLLFKPTNKCHPLLYCSRPPLPSFLLLLLRTEPQRALAATAPIRRGQPSTAPPHSLLDPLLSFSTSYRCSPTPPWRKSQTRSSHRRPPSTFLRRRFGLPVDPAVQQLLPLAITQAGPHHLKQALGPPHRASSTPSMLEHHRRGQARPPPPRVTVGSTPPAILRPLQPLASFLVTH
jgi:hypothetical protein